MAELKEVSFHESALPSGWGAGLVIWLGLVSIFAGYVLLVPPGTPTPLKSILWPMMNANLGIFCNTVINLSRRIFVQSYMS